MQAFLSTLILLGAGASIEAGVPASTAMTREIVNAVDTWQNDFGGTVQAINYAVGAMIAHRTAHGARVFAGIDVEDLFSAVQMLADQDRLEVAPFVQWSPALSGIRPKPKTMPSWFDDDFRKAVQGDRFKQPSALIQSAIESLTESGGASSADVFASLQYQMLQALSNLVRVREKKVGYLSPLLDQGGDPIQIATLNYDRTIEILASDRGLRVDTGIEGWSGGKDWSWAPAADLRLLKLHGSIDWRIVEERGAGGIHESRVVAMEDGEKPSPYSLPGVVFGTRGKLRADGPFLSMLREFDEMLGRSERLLVVGYSFRDSHINVAIGRWINARPRRQLTIIDPDFGSDPRVDSQHDFAAEIRTAAAPRTHGGYQGLHLNVIRAKASEALAKGVLWPPDPTP